MVNLVAKPANGLMVSGSAQPAKQLLKQLHMQHHWPFPNFVIRETIVHRYACEGNCHVMYV
jgi:hypothetical protein